MEQLTFTADPGITDFYVLPEGSDPADWEDNAVDAEELYPGFYSAMVDPSINKVWRLFRGSTQPNWNSWLQVFPIASVTVLPTQGESDREYSVATIEASIDAELLIGRTVIDGNGDPVLLPPVEFVLCDKNQKHIATLNPVVTGASYTVVVPRALTTVERTIFFALRKTDSSNVDLDRGTIQFVYAATAPS